MLLAGALSTGCNPVDRSVRAWVESRDPKGNIVAGAIVEIDGQPAGMTDRRGLYHVRIRRHVGAQVTLHVYEDGAHSWSGAFTVNSSGTPAETRGGRIIATLPGGS